MIPTNPEGLLEELWKTPKRVHQTIRLLDGSQPRGGTRTPSRVVAELGRVKLLAYHGKDESNGNPLVLVPSIINRGYVLDLRPGASLVEYLRDQGQTVYMVDWGTPGPQDRYADFDMHIKWLHALIRKACKDAGSKKAHVLGYCIGGTIATVYAAMHPERVASLVALTAPIDFHDDGMLSCWSQTGEVPAEHLARFMGNIDSEWLQSSFKLLKPVSDGPKWRGFAQNLWNEKFLESFFAMEEWVTDNVDVPGASYVTLIRDLYEGNKLIQGTFEVGGEKVDLGKITCPVLVPLSKVDHIVRPPSAKSLADYVSSEETEVLEFNGGHIGVVVGRAARTGLWPALDQWMDKYDISLEDDAEEAVLN